MPVELAETVTLRTIGYKSWRITSEHYDNLHHNTEALCEFTLELIDENGAVVETRRRRIPVAVLAQKYPELYAQHKAASYTEVGLAEGLAEGELT